MTNQFPDATKMVLSPAAQAVLIAEAKSRCLREERDCHPDDSDWNGCYICVHRRGLAAALRAAADQVVPEDYDCAVEDIGWYHAAEVRHAVIREQLLAIADELEAS
jgi:hypothetical protein